jgi:hypothetical protein
MQILCKPFYIAKNEKTNIVTTTLNAILNCKVALVNLSGLAVVVLYC